MNIYIHYRDILEEKQLVNLHRLSVHQKIQHNCDNNKKRMGQLIARLCCGREGHNKESPEVTRKQERIYDGMIFFFERNGNDVYIDISAEHFIFVLRPVVQINNHFLICRYSTYIL